MLSWDFFSSSPWGPPSGLSAVRHRRPVQPLPRSIPPPGPAGSGWDPDGGCGPQRRGCNSTPTFPNDSLELTDTNTFEAGSDFYATPLTINSSFSLTVSFDLRIEGGDHTFGTSADGADG